MKKLVTLSAIALAGATLGVGTTFGWWSDDSVEPKTKPQPTVVEQSPADAPKGDIEFLGDELPTKNAVRRLGSGAVILESWTEESKPGGPEGQRIRFIDPGSSAAGIEKFIDELESEAKKREATGQKEAAGIQRNLAQRLREFLKGDQKKLQEAVERLNEDKAKKHVEITIIESRKKPPAAGQTLFNKQEQHIENQNAQMKLFSPDFVPTNVHKMQAGQIKDVATELTEIAGQLEKNGQKEQAQALRNQAERLNQKSVESRFTVTRGDDGVVHRKPGKDVQQLEAFDHKIALQAQEQERMAFHRFKEAEARMRERAEMHARQQAEELAGQKSQAHGHHEAPHPGDIHRLLHELHREIGQLREEVGDLRRMLSDDRHAEDRDRKHREEHDDDDDAKPGKKKPAPEKAGKFKGDVQYFDDAPHGKKPQADAVRKTKTKAVEGQKAKPGEKKSKPEDDGEDNVQDDAKVGDQEGEESDESDDDMKSDVSEDQQQEDDKEEQDKGEAAQGAGQAFRFYTELIR